MKAPGLSKHYPELTPAERLALMLAAAARGDDVEHVRLAAAAPRVTVRVPDTFGRALALWELLQQQRMEVLSLAADYFHALGTAEAMNEGNGLSDAGRRCLDGALLLGYLFRVRVAGWGEFCKRHGLDSSALEPLLPGGSVIDRATAATEHDAFSAESALECLRRKEPATAVVPTAETMADQLQELHQARLSCWD